MTNNAKRYVGWFLVVSILIYFVYLVKGVMLPFVAGGFIAYALNPMTTRLAKISFINRAAAATISTVFFIFVLVLFFLLVVPTLQTELVKIASKMPAYGKLIQEYWVGVVHKISDRLDPSDVAKIQEGIRSYSIKLFEWLGKMAVNMVSTSFALVNFITILIVTPITVFYLLHDWEKITKVVFDFVPRGSLTVFKEQLGLIDRALAGFARGQAMVCIILSFFYIIGLRIVGLDAAFTVGLVTGILAFIPYVGLLIGFLMAIILGVSQFGGMGAPILWVSVVYLIGAVFEGKILTPNLIGGKIGLHPLWVIFALFAGGAIGGFGGILIAVPVAGVIGVLVRYTLQNYKNTKFYIGDGSVPEKKAKAKS